MISRAHQLGGDYVSPSQINTAVSCLRKWGWDKLEGVRAPPHRSAEAGTLVHSRLEDWLKLGKPPNINEVKKIDGRDYHIGMIAMNGMHHLPSPGPHIVVESTFRFGHWLGRMDMAWASIDGIFLQPSEILLAKDSFDVVPGVGDHKTTGNMAYALTEVTLPTDPQGIIYANAMFEDFPHASFVDELWVYYGTSKPYPSKKVHLRIARDMAEYKIRPLDRIAEGLLRLKGTPGLRALDLPPNPSACGDYGGCPHRSRCGLSASDLMKGTFRMEQSLDEKIAAAAQQVNGVGVAQVPVGISIAPDPNAWITHQQDARYEWQPSTGQLRAAAPALPPPIVSSAGFGIAPPTQMSSPPPLQYVQSPQPVVQIQALPPIVMMPPALGALPPGLAPIGPDGQPFGSVNAPEGRGQSDIAQPAVASAVQVDDLEAMTKEQLLIIAKSMGLDTKGLRAPGCRDKIRGARAAGVVPTGAPAPAFAAVGSNANGAGPIAPSGPSSVDVDWTPGQMMSKDGAREFALRMIGAGAMSTLSPQQIIDTAAHLEDLLALKYDEA